MTKFLNKKEQVYDLKLTSYGHYLLSIGEFKPTYYAFFDDNVLYDGAYANITESQNTIHERIKDNTQYLESFVLFRDVADYSSENIGSEVNFFSVDVTPTQRLPRRDIYVYGANIGDAFLDGETQSAPAWKVVALQGLITSSTTNDALTLENIPQINMTLKYRLTARDPDAVDALGGVRSLDFTSPFVDGKVISLESDDAVIYFDEVNTELLTKNFDVEVFERVTGSNDLTIERRFFKKQIPQIQDGFMVLETPQELSDEQLNSGSVEYYFDLLTDSKVNTQLACRGAQIFNKNSYYVDLDFNCDEEPEEREFFDIYGTVTEPEICLD